MKIILASKSPRRKELLKRVVPRFQVMESGVREFDCKHKTPVQSAEANALRKAKKVSEKLRNGLVIGSDTIVVLGREILGKPKTLTQARRMLTRLSGKIHRVITAVAVIEKRDGKIGKLMVFHETTKVRFKRSNSQEIDQYVQKVRVLDKAGSYGIQERPRIVGKIWGSYTNVMGLPVEKLRKVFRSLRARRSNLTVGIATSLTLLAMTSFV